MLKNISKTTLGLLVSLSVSSYCFAQAAKEPAATDEKATPTSMQFGNGGLTSVEVKNLHHSGKLFVKKIKVTDSTIINGFFEAIDSQFNKDTVVNGNLVATTSVFNDLSINGNVKLNTVAITGPANINGKLTVDKSDFKNTLNIYGQLEAKETSFAKLITVKSTETEFDNCKVDSLKVQKTTTDAVQKVSLKGTTVNGDITFESGKGIVEQDGKSTINGKVTGGKVEKK